MSSRQGKDHKIYLSADLLTDTVGGGATWLEFTPVESTNSDISREEVTFKTRENGGAEQTLGGSLSNTIEVNWAYLSGDTEQELLLDSIVADNSVACADMDGDITTPGNSGQIGNYTITNYAQDKPIDGVVNVTASLKLADAFFNMNYKIV
jgi:hypothetical protein